MGSGKSRDTLRIPNLKQMQQALKDLGISNKEMGQASFVAGEVTAKAIRGIMVPFKKSGKLLKSVKALKGYKKVIVKAGNNTTAKYAGLQNFGSKKKNVEPKFFFQMGIRKTRQYVLEIYYRELQKLVNKAERKTNK